jgi:hypothetical protein
MKTAGFRIRPFTACERGVERRRFQVVGYLGEERVRRRFATREEAIGEKLRLEVQAANMGQIRPVNTRLLETQVRCAETIFALTPDPLAAVQWYLANYLPPCVDKALRDAIGIIGDSPVPLPGSFLAALKPNVELVHWNDTRRRLLAFEKVFPTRIVCTLETAEIETYLNGQGWGNKNFNNTRGTLHAFFDYCGATARRWAKDNPIAAIPQKKVARGLPTIETAAKLGEMFSFLETYTGGPRKPRKPGFLVPYFALATFAGMRPSVPDGEVWKLGNAVNAARLLNVKNGVIHVTPEIAKTDGIRQVKIRPNLAAWLQRYPLEEYPITMTNMEALVMAVRKKFQLADDVLRHTWISAHVAKFKSLGEAALEAGNSESIIRAHYLNVMSEEEAEMFWSILPSASATAI